jgi:hypothetical protein
MIPLVGVLIYGANINTKNLRILLGLWLAPVILKPLIWPVYALSIGEFRLWESGVFLQLHRISQPLVDSVSAFFKSDPILFLLGIAGLGYSFSNLPLYYRICFIVSFYSINTSTMHRRGQTDCRAAKENYKQKSSASFSACCDFRNSDLWVGKHYRASNIRPYYFSV